MFVAGPIEKKVGQVFPEQSILVSMENFLGSTEDPKRCTPTTYSFVNFPPKKNEGYALTCKHCAQWIIPKL